MLVFVNKAIHILLQLILKDFKICNNNDIIIEKKYIVLLT